MAIVNKTRPHRSASQGGFSLLESLISMSICVILLGTVFQQIYIAQVRARSEERQLEEVQQGREFMDRLSRDLNQLGYPNSRMFDSATFGATSANSGQVAVGLIAISSTMLWFEGDVDGDGRVESVRYQVVAAADGTCPCSILRSQVTKVDGTAPESQPTNYLTQLSDVVNSGGAGGSSTAGSYPIAGSSAVAGAGGTISMVSNDVLYADYKVLPLFTVIDSQNQSLALPLTRIANPDSIASIRVLRTTLTLLGPVADNQTRRRPDMSLELSKQISQ
jgi:type II secretory pathway pseudopilin PulG